MSNVKEMQTILRYGQNKNSDSGPKVSLAEAKMLVAAAKDWDGSVSQERALQVARLLRDQSESLTSGALRFLKDAMAQSPLQREYDGMTDLNRLMAMDAMVNVPEGEVEDGTFLSSVKIAGLPAKVQKQIEAFKDTFLEHFKENAEGNEEYTFKYAAVYELQNEAGKRLGYAVVQNGGYDTQQDGACGFISPDGQKLAEIFEDQ